MSLFESDTSFLEELTGPGSSAMGPETMPRMGNGIMAPGMQQVTQQQTEMMMGQQRPSAQASYGQMQSFSQESFRTMGSQNAVIGNQQYQTDEYNQYSSVPKLHHINDQMLSSGSGSNMMQQQTMQQHQFASPPSAASHMMQPRHGGYQNYGMSPGPRMPKPQQQQQIGSMQQNSAWNPTQTSPTHLQYASQQQMTSSTGQMSSYLPQHDYNTMSNSCPPVQRLAHYPDTSQPTGQTSPYMGSPPAGSHVPMGPSSSPGSGNMIGQIQQAPAKQSQVFQQGPSDSQVSIGLSGFGMGQTQQLQQYPSDFMAQRAQMNSGTSAQTNKLQHYSYPAPNQQNSQQISPNMTDTSSLTHFPNQTSTSMPVAYRQNFSGMPQRATTPSPRPVPTPPTQLAPNHSNNSQGTFGQSSLQHLEQLVPQMGSVSNTNPFQSVMQTSSVSNVNLGQKAPVYSNSSFQATTVISSSQVPSSVQSGTGISVNIPNPNHSLGPVSPSQNMLIGLPNQQNMNMEIQQLQQQIQELYSMSQTQEIQQQMLDLQERVRILKAQQQQQILQLQQRQQQQQQQQPPPPVSLPQSGQPARIIMIQRPRMPLQQVVPQQKQMMTIQIQQQPHPQSSQPVVMSQLSPTPPRTPQMIATSSPQRVQQPFMKPPTPSSQSEQSVQASTSQPLTVELDSFVQSPPLTSSNIVPLINMPDSLEPSLEDPIALSPPTLDTLTSFADNDKENDGQEILVDKTKAQSKAHLIVTEAIAKVQIAGQIPGTFSPEPIPSTINSVITDVTLETPTSTKKLPKKPRKKRDPKPKGEKSEKKEKSPRVRKKKKKEEVIEVDPTVGTDGLVSVDGLVIDVGSNITLPTVLDTESGEKKEKKEIVKKEKKPRTPKPKTPKKKKPPPTLLKKKKKTKRGLSSDCSDLDLSPPSSPKEEDESLKRRSARNTNRKKYMDDVDINLSDDDNTNIDIEGIDGPLTMKAENPDEDSVVVEKILGVRMRKKDKEEVEEDPDEPEEEEEFIVKYKNYSFLHCEWKTIPELEKCDKRIHGKIKRYRVKRNNQMMINMPEDEEYFNPDYVEVDRVLEESVTTDPMTDNKIVHYLVKWRGLSYEESTWELQQDVDPKKVALFNQWRIPPPEEEREIVVRPKPSEWKKLEENRIYKGGNELREYQQEGVNWLTFCWFNEQNCILADEMGLGKTVQSITFLVQMYEYGIKAPYLVVAPLSTIANWHREFETWTDMNVITYHGTTASRLMLQEYEMYYKDSDGKRIPNIYRFNALITTYELIITDWETLSAIEWRCMIIDEAHRLKNRNCRLMDGLRQFDIDHRVLLSGTPLQNNTDELFSLLNFLDSKKYCNAKAFIADFGDLKTEAQVDDLKKILKPMMLRRLKEDVEKNLAPKEETIIEVELTNIQKKYYRAILEKNFSFLEKTGANVPSLMNTMMELRKCCNHPYLVNGAEEKILDDTRVKYGNNMEQFSMALVKSCGKMVLLDKLLPKLKQGGHKVLVFSQMIRVLDILEDYLIQRKYLYERLDGRIRGNLRQEAIDRFSKPDSDRFVFLLCTRAGGLGINLTAADTVVIYDSDWNPQNDLQAQARCHRIGQTKEVKVYRLITRNSYEREMFDRASLKLGLDKAVLQSDKTVNTQSQLSKKEIEDLLKKGAYGALMDDDNAGDEFCEEDIDQILQRRTQIIQIESEGKGSTFAKASFSMSSERSDIDINDPNFWQKWAKKADIDVDEIKGRNNLIIDLPRRRKQTSRYGNEDGVMEMSELESSSSSDEEGGVKSGRKSSRRKKKNRNDDDVDYGGEELIRGENYWRSECFKVEKNLLVYGWGRWAEIVSHSHFKRGLEEKDVESIAKAILVHSLQFYKGDERIKGFIWDLVSQNDEDQLKNHSGLSAPVPRGRKGKKAKQDNRGYSEELEKANLDFDPDKILDHGYKRHLHRHSNKVLLRVRLLYYLRQEVIGEEAEKVFKQLPLNEIDIPAPIADGDLPALWWDDDCDRSLIIGVFKHGYEKFNQMRSDPKLAFLQRCGPPDGDALAREQNDDDDNDNRDEDDLEEKSMNLKDEEDEEDVSLSSAPESAKKTQKQPTEEEVGKLPWPTVSDLNTRLRRLVTGYQRNNKKVQLRLQQKAKKMERREKADAVLKEREVKKKEYLQKLVSIRWSRREEADFYRTVSTFGVEYNRAAGRYRWDRFRCFARLDKKYDDTLVEYFQAFYHMCQRVCGKFKTSDEAKPPHNMYVEPISEERASRCLARIDLLNKIREEILLHPKLDEYIKLCQQSFDMPSWWQCGKNDKELLIGAARHGLARTDYHILRDPTLSFHEILRTRGLRTPNPQFGGLNNPYTGMYMGGVPAGMSMSDVKVPSDVKENTPVKNEFADTVDSKCKKIKCEESLSSEENCVKGDGDDAIKENSTKIKEEHGDVVKEEADIPVKDEASDNEERMEVDRESSSDETLVKKEAVIKETEVKKETEIKKEVEVKEEADVKEEAEVKKEVEVKEEAEIKEEAEVKTEDDVEEKTVDEVVKEEAGVVKSEADVERKPDDKDFDDNETEDETDTKNEASEKEVEDKETDVKTECANSELIKELEKDEISPAERGSNGKDKTKENKFEKELKENENFVKLKQKEVEEQLEREKSKFHNMMQTKPEIVRMEEDMMRSLPPYPSMYLDENYIDMEGMEPGEVMMGRCGVLGPTLDWPKDRVVFHRLEHICYTIENGEWPFARRQPPPQFFPPTPFDSRSGTPVGSTTPRGDQSLADSDAAESITDPLQVMRGDSEKDFEVLYSENEGLKMTFQKRGRGRRRKYEINPERAAQVQHLLNQSAASAASSDNESQPEPMNLTSAAPTPNESILNGDSPVPVLDPSQLSAKLMAEGLVPERKRRGRKRKAEKLAELAMAEALAKRHQARLLSSLDPEGRVPVICVEDGSRLTGDDAPMKKDAERWLMEHPNYILDQPDDEEEPGEITHHGIMPELFEKPRRGRRPKLDPRMLDIGTLTGEENVSVVDRESGKKITGAKAPPLRHLAEWLEKNPTYDVEAKWGELVRAKGSLPKSMDTRILKPSGRGRKSRESMLHPSFLGDMTYPGALSAMAGFPEAVGLMGAFPKLPLNMPFGALPNLGLPNPMLAMGGLGLPGFPVSSSLTKITDSDPKDKTSSDKDGKGDKKSDSSSLSSPHPSFPAFYYNPLMYSSLLAAQGIPGFPIPTSIPASLAGLINPSAVNGRLELEEEQEQRLENEALEKIKEFSHKKAKLSNHDSGEKSHSLHRKSEEHRSHSSSHKGEEHRSHSSGKGDDHRSHSSGKGDDHRSRSSNKGDDHRSNSSNKGDRHYSRSETKAEDLSMKKRRSHGAADVKIPLIVPTPQVSQVPQEEATDLTIKTKPKNILNTDNLKVLKDLKMKKSKSKMFSSSKLSKIVDSLKDKVMKIEKKEMPKETPVACDSEKPVSEHSSETTSEEVGCDKVDDAVKSK